MLALSWRSQDRFTPSNVKLIDVIGREGDRPYKHYPYPLLDSSMIARPSITALNEQKLELGEDVVLPVFHFDRVLINQKLEIVRELNDATMESLWNIYTKRSSTIYNIGATGFYLYPYQNSVINLRLNKCRYISANNKVEMLNKLYTKFCNIFDLTCDVESHVNSIFSLVNSNIYYATIDYELVLRYSLLLIDSPYFRLPSIETYNRLLTDNPGIGLPTFDRYHEKSVIPLVTMLKSILRMSDLKVERLNLTPEQFNSSNYIWYSPFLISPLTSNWLIDYNNYSTSIDQRFLDVRMNMLGQLVQTQLMILLREPQCNSLRDDSSKGIEVIIPSISPVEGMDKLDNLIIPIRGISAGETVKMRNIERAKDVNVCNIAPLNGDAPRSEREMLRRYLMSELTLLYMKSFIAGNTSRLYGVKI